MKKIFTQDNIELFKPDFSELELLYGGDLAAGAFSDVDDFAGERIDINKLLIKHPDATFYARVKGSSMIDDFQDGDLLIIDRSEEWFDNRIALCYMNNEFTLKRIKIENGECKLIPSNKDYPTISINDENNLMIWGIVTFSIKKH